MNLPEQPAEAPTPRVMTTARLLPPGYYLSRKLVQKMADVDAATLAIMLETILAYETGTSCTLVSE